MKNFLSARKKKTIVAAVAAGICFSGSAEAVEQFNIDWDGKTIFNIKYYGASDYTDSRAAFFNVPNQTALCYDLTSDIKSGLNKAFKWWAEILGPSANISQPAQYFVGTSDYRNAGADSVSYKNGIMTKNPDLFSRIFQDGQNVAQYNDLEDIPQTTGDQINSTDDIAYGLVIIGQNMALDHLNDGGYGFLNSAYYANPTPDLRIGMDISAVMFHEIGHSLGISTSRDAFTEEPLPGKNYPGFYLKAFDDKTFTAHLYDQNGRQTKINSVILASEDDVSVLNQYLEENPDKKSQFSSENIFVVDNTQEARNTGKTYLYFAGDNVTEVLDGKTFTRGDGQQISGIPINLWESQSVNGQTFYAPDFSHIELARSMMSHQRYRSYVNFMEAELAALQDMGYNIDRRNFYGRSIYNDGLTLTNYQGFSARENGEYVDGYNNSTFGIGLHVYGSNNNITQAGDIFSNGAGAVGVRVDGVNNTITVAKDTEIHADGSYSDGVLIAYGKNHNVNIEGTVTATGESGNALSFNFGSNSLGSDQEYRGSFMRYIRSISNNEVRYAYNLPFTTIEHQNDVWSFTDKENGDLNAPMVNTVNISGKLIADPANGGNAIYIDSSAFVDTININDGAELTGGIMSMWKHYSTYEGMYDYETPIRETDENGNLTKYIDGLKLQYNGGTYLYTKYIPDLVTKLNFNNTMAYNGNIWGYDNMKMNVNGNLIFGGDASVVNVNVAKGAGLFGGNFTVNDMTENMAEGFSDDTTGKFFNHGTIGAAYNNQSMTINGNLISDGTLSGYGGGNLGNIVVNGSANVDGSIAAATNILPDETMTILQADSITGNLKNSSTAEKISGMLSATGKIENNQISVTAKAENNLGELTSEQNQSFNAVSRMFTNLQNDSRKSELRTIYSLDGESAKNALEQIGNADASQMMSATQQNSVANRVISDRLATVFSMQNFDFNVSENKSADDDENNLVLGVSATAPMPVENNFWLKFTKNWGELRGGANYHGQAISGGYDKKFGENWRGGLFVSYNATGLGAENSSGNIYDTRFGIYAGYHKNVDDAFIYIDGGKIRNKLHRNISSLGLSTDAKYNSNIFEIGGEYKRNLTPDKNFSISPYVNLQYSRLKQNGYSEEGAGIFNQQVNSKSNNYFAGQLGVEYKRNFSTGNYAARIGVKHAFTGANPELNFNYEGDANNTYTLKNNQNKTHFIISLNGENEFAKNWIIGGDIQFQKGKDDKDLSASIMLRKVW